MRVLSHGRLTAQMFTLHELIDTSLALVRSFNSGLRTWVERHQDQVRYCQQYVEPLPHDRITEIVHLGITNALASAQFGQKTLWQPNRIEIDLQPGLDGVFHDFFEGPIVIGLLRGIW
jgi:hypothetical protein